MKKTQSKYVEITAECSVHGRFTVQRKPNPRRELGGAGSGRKASGFYDAVKCPKCPFWAKIIDQKMLVKPSAAPERGSLLLGGVDA